MKTPLLIISALFAFASNSVATTRTVSNDGAGGSQFSTLLAAYTASSNGDTLLVEGTNVPVSHTSVAWDKNLVVIGIGFNPQKQNPKRTQFNFFQSSAFNDFSIITGGSGSKFYGIEFMATVTFRASVTNLTFENCRFNGVMQFNNQSAVGVNFKNCIFDPDNSDNITFSSSATNSNILISNCSFDGMIDGTSNVILSLTIDHCQFLATTVAPLDNLKNALIKNSVFMNRSTQQSGSSSGNSFTCNISRLGGLPSGSGNINSTDPSFVSYTTNTMYSTSHDYHLNSGSAAIGKATDSTDMGIHGGFANFSENGEVLIVPIIRLMNINNSIVAPNGTLNIQINATKPDDN